MSSSRGASRGHEAASTKPGTATTQDVSQSDADDVQRAKRRKLSPDELENLNRRVYTDAMSSKQKKLIALEEKMYRTEPPKTLDAKAIEASVTRQVNAEMDRRKKREEELREKFFKTAEPQTLTETEVEECTRRIYSEAMRRHAEGLAKLEQKHALRPKTSDPLSPEKVKESANRLCKPKKAAYSDDEINKILGIGTFQGLVSLPPLKVKALADRLSKPK